MPDVNLEKLKKISCDLKSLCQLVFILNTYLNANQDYSEECSNALILSEIVFAELEKTHDNLFYYLQDIYMEINSREKIEKTGDLI